MTRSPALFLLGLAACTGDKSDDTDLLDAIEALPAVRWVSELEPAIEGARQFALAFEQPTDHDDPDSATFEQIVGLTHRGADAPMVLATKGYGASLSGEDDEPSALLEANRLEVEHRYFVNSRPSDPDWDLLRTTQESADLHEITSAFKELYPEPWIATGASKGGMTALFYRASYPDDVAGTVAYVAPFIRGYPDTDFAGFFETVGDAACRDTLVTMQRTLLADRERLAAELETWDELYDITFDKVSVDWAFQVSVSELPWTFWQYAGDCTALPVDPTDIDEVWAWMVDSDSTPYWYADSVVDYFGPYFFQCAAELGYPAVDHAAIADLLTVDPADVEPLLPAGAALPSYDPAEVEAAEDWLSTEGSTLLLIYGDQDPWTVGELVLDGATDSYSFTAVGGNHLAGIGDLDSADQDTALEALFRWAGRGPALHPPRTP